MRRFMLPCVLLLLASCELVEMTEPGGIVPERIPLECAAADPYVECDADDRCWARLAVWSAWAELADLDAIAVAVLDGDLVETDAFETSATCYDVIDTEEHVCVMCVDGVALLGQPQYDLLLTASVCGEFDGLIWPWQFVGETLDGACYGVLDGVAVELTALAQL